MQSESSIRRAAARLDAALESGDRSAVVECFAPDCEIELLGVRLRGHEGVRRWLGWVFAHITRIKFAPRLIAVAGDEFIEEFRVEATTNDGKVITGQWAEILTYRDDLVSSLRLYFDPMQFAPALGSIRSIAGAAATRMARRGLEPFEVLEGDR
jgi:ketosteroid isomerase-like protein